MLLRRTQFLSDIPVLQGYMYLTDSYLCFFAHMPAKEVCTVGYRCNVVTDKKTGPSTEVRLVIQESTTYQTVDTALVHPEE